MRKLANGGNWIEFAVADTAHPEGTCQGRFRLVHRDRGKRFSPPFGGVNLAVYVGLRHVARQTGQVRRRLPSSYSLPAGRSGKRGSTPNRSAILRTPSVRPVLGASNIESERRPRRCVNRLVVEGQGNLGASADRNLSGMAKDNRSAI